MFADGEVEVYEEVRRSEKNSASGFPEWEVADAG